MSNFDHQVNFFYQHGNNLESSKMDLAINLFYCQQMCAFGYYLFRGEGGSLKQTLSYLFTLWGLCKKWKLGLSDLSATKDHFLYL